MYVCVGRDLQSSEGNVPKERAGEACGSFSRNYQTDFQYDCTILFSYWQCLNDTGKSGASEILNSLSTHPSYTVQKYPVCGRLCFLELRGLGGQYLGLIKAFNLLDRCSCFIFIL